MDRYPRLDSMASMTRQARLTGMVSLTRTHRLFRGYGYGWGRRSQSINYSQISQALVADKDELGLGNPPSSHPHMGIRVCWVGRL